MLDTEEMARWERLTAAMLARAATDDPEAFAQVVGLLDRARDLLPNVAWQLRTRASASGGDKLDGYSWAELARPLGVTRSAVAQRFTRVRIGAVLNPANGPLAQRFRDYLRGGE